RAHRPALPGPGSRHRAEPQARASEPRPGRLRRLRSWNQSSSSGDDERAATTADEDARDQAAVLRHVLSLYPQTLTMDELAREMIGFASSQPAERDPVERAVR